MKTASALFLTVWWLAVELMAPLTCAAQNPVLPDFHADPEVMYSHQTGRYYIYSTTDGVAGWAGTFYSAYSSADLKESPACVS